MKNNLPKGLLLFLIFIAVMQAGGGLQANAGPFKNLPGRKELLEYRNASATKVLSSEGELIGKFYLENRTNVTYSQTPGHLIDALVATEDARFFSHRGVDSRSLARVLFKTILAGKRSSGGGSTITQQLAKNMYGRQKTGMFSILRNKLREMILARRIEKTFTKEEILTLYLNTVSFGEDLFGIEAAALRYFNRKVEDLRIEESAVLVGMLKAPSFYHPVVHPENAIKRRNLVISQMEKYGFLRSAESDSLSRLGLITDYRNPESESIAGYFLSQVRKEADRILSQVNASGGRKWELEKDGLVITTTLSLTLQKFAAESFREHLPVMQEKLAAEYDTPSGRKIKEGLSELIIRESRLEKWEGIRRKQILFGWDGYRTDSLTVRDSIMHSLTLLHAGLLALDPRTGAILAWVGGIDYGTQPFDQVTARRQLGSAFKPVLFAAALEDGISPCTYLDNDSLTVEGYEDWSPENYDQTYGGKYSLAGTLVRSMNVPSFSLFMKTGFESVDSMWKAMGFSFALDNKPSLPLGTAEASIRETAIAYSAFANGGYIVSPYSVTSVISPTGEILYDNGSQVQGDRIVRESTSLLMGAILRRAVDEGTGAAARSRFGLTLPLAGKTGTSQNYSDAWFAAFNPGIAIVARAGASMPAIHFSSGADGTGSSLALPLVALTLKKAEIDPVLRDKIVNPFPDLPPELAEALQCPDFREDNVFDRITDFFRKDEIVFDTTSSASGKKLRSLIRKIFRK
ncbi:MAG: transglycosylase domain-containing protein [Bacteroidales bacterium]|nr:transglycosylase domain-containing protein [Bacteroidales bacterium]